ncbi:MAG: HIT family hydrolase [Propionibacteriales bacterium]|nr:MAG: HIT family hydrolase [Propionibacteriales bacterium]
MTDSQDGYAGCADPFERLWTPHRMVYIKGENKPTAGGNWCPFCTAPEKSDSEGLIVARGDTCYVVLNLYPYSPGHLLVCPYRHVADFADLTDDETCELAQLTKRSMQVIRAAGTPAGFNLGMNQGEVSGAGIAGHLHQHVVPRWQGDMNFMPIIARTKVLPELLGQTRTRLASAWEAC